MNMDNVPGMKNCPSGPCAYWTMVAPVAEVVDGLALVMVSVWRPWDTATPSELEICMVPAGKTTKGSMKMSEKHVGFEFIMYILHLHKENRKWIKKHIVYICQKNKILRGVLLAIFSLYQISNPGVY